MRQSTLLLTLLLVFSAFSLFSCSGDGGLSLPGADPPKAYPTLLLTEQVKQPVLSVESEGAVDIKYGFEGGRVVRLGDTYHLFTSEMVDDPIWVSMRLGHWTSSNGLEWRRESTLFESSGNFDGTDPRASLWSPLPVYDPEEERWNLFYVAYHSEPNTPEQFLSNHSGRIWRAVSTQPGRQGIGGPYQDVGVIMQPDPQSQDWEGLQGVDSFFPYQVDDAWFAFYGSARSEVRPIEYWRVGLAKAPKLEGPWKRLAEGNPLEVESVFIENPIVTQLYSGVYVAVYDHHGEDTIGYSYSHNGIEWSEGRSLEIQPEPGSWAGEVRTPMGLVSEPERNVFTLFYTGFRGEPDWDAIMRGEMSTTCAVGKVSLRIVYESTGAYKDAR